MKTQPVGLAGVLLILLTASVLTGAEERQITFSPTNHNLDNNDNFSPDSKFLCYDTRNVVGNGIGNCQSIEKVEIATGNETVLYTPPRTIVGEEPAPGVGGPFYSPVEEKVAFIHGPLVEEVEARGPYGKPNRRGMEVHADGSREWVWLDYRDVATSRDTLPGAHRGGTHRHEYSLDGKRIGFTYDDFLLPQFDRTIAYLEPHPDAPGDATHYFALLVPIVPKGTSKAGEIEKAWGDNWVGSQGLMRAFIGKVRAADGESYEQSLFVVDVPADVDITTADSGSAERFPTPPQGLRVRRLTHTWADGNTRGSYQGDRIAYLAKAPDGSIQVFLIASDGSDRSRDAAKRPIQATHLEDGAAGGLRWHPSGNSIACFSDNGVAVTCVKPGPLFGRTVFLTPQGDSPKRESLVWSPNGKILAFNKTLPTFDADGKRARNYKGEDLEQIFIVEFPDADGDGIVDGLGDT